MSQNMIAESPIHPVIAKLYPYLLLLTAGAGLGLTILLKRPELSVFSLIMVVPLVLAAIILIIKRKAVPNLAALPTLAARIGFGNLFWAGTLVFTISLIMLVSNAVRPPAYFVLVSLYAAAILWQIMTKRPAWTNVLIVIEIMALSLNLVWGVSLKYPLYFGDTDLLQHFHFIDTILQTGYVDPNLYYQHYPLYHIFAASGVEVTGISIRMSVFILMGVAWQVCILLAYLIFRNLSKSSKLALVGCLLFASSSQLIFYGTYAIARSLAFVFLIAWIYLVINKAQNDRHYLFLSLIVMGVMIVTHHLNVLFVIPAMALVYICQLVINRSRTERLVDPLFVYLVTVCAISYLLWVAADMAGDSLPPTIRDILSSDLTLGGDFTRGYGLPVIFGALYYSFILLLCLLGMRSFMNSGRFAQKRRLAAAFALAGLVMLVLFIPGPLDLLTFSQTVLTARLQLLVTPFVIFLAAFGIKYLYDLARTRGSQVVRFSLAAVLPVGLVAAMTFFSMVSTGNAKDTDYLPHTVNIDSPYFTAAELQSFSFLNDKLDADQPLYSDYETIRNSFTLNELDNRNILRSGDINSLTEGYLMLRTGELERKKALTFSSTGNAVDNYRYYVDSNDPQNNILANLQSRIKVYSDGDMETYILAP